MLNTLMNSLKQAKKLDQSVDKYTMLINEKSETEGVLCFVPQDGRKEIKVLLPAPYHQDLLASSEIFTYKQLLSHKEAIVLK